MSWCPSQEGNLELLLMLFNPKPGIIKPTYDQFSHLFIYLVLHGLVDFSFYKTVGHYMKKILTGISSWSSTNAEAPSIRI